MDQCICRVQGLGRVKGLGTKVQVQAVGSRVWGLASNVCDLGFRMKGLGCRILGLGPAAAVVMTPWQSTGMETI